MKTAAQPTPETRARVLASLREDGGPSIAKIATTHRVPRDFVRAVAAEEKIERRPGPREGHRMGGVLDEDVVRSLRLAGKNDVEIAAEYKRRGVTVSKQAVNQARKRWSIQ